MVAASFACTAEAQKRTTRKAAVTKTPSQTLTLKGAGDTASPKVVTITSAFKPFLKNAAKVNFTAATPVIDSSRIPVVYTIPSQNLFFLYQPAALKPLALAVDSGYIWENDQYIKAGAGNFSSFFGEAAFSFGDGQHSVTNIKGNFITATGHLPSQQASRWGIDVLSVFNTGKNNEWTTHPFYKTTTQYFYGYEPSTLAYQKDFLLQQFNTIGIEAGLQNKLANSFGITYHPQFSFIRFSDNRENRENNVVIKAPINKSFGKIYAFDLGLTADMSTSTFPLIPNSRVFKNNLYYLDPSIQFITPNFKVNAGIRPSWDNKVFSILPNVTAEAKLLDANLVVEAGWVGYFQKNTFRSLTDFNPWIMTLTDLQNTRIREQYAGIKGAKGDHFTYQARFSLLHFNNKALFVNDLNDGKTFGVLFEPEMSAVRLHGELGYTVQEKFSFLGAATYTQYNSFSVNPKAWGLLPLEVTGSVKWKLLKDLQMKADVFLWDGAPYRDKTLNSRKADPAADLNLGAEFAVMPKVNLWIQMNNLLNNTYQRWNQYQVLGFNVLGGVVYSFR
ncbi:MAG: TonB-dependent receptor [Sediminibacterium sp.]|nr:TonB-dependent receptor [Sediminibacterium sp.]